MLSRRQTRWSEELQRYHFEWVYRPGKQNVADPLSRNPAYKQSPSVLAVMTRSRVRAWAQDEVPSPVSATSDSTAKQPAEQIAVEASEAAAVTVADADMAEATQQAEHTLATGANTVGLGPRDFAARILCFPQLVKQIHHSSSLKDFGGVVSKLQFLMTQSSGCTSFKKLTTLPLRVTLYQDLACCAEKLHLASYGG